MGEKHLKEPSHRYTTTSHGREHGVPSMAPVVLLINQVPVSALHHFVLVPVITNVVAVASTAMVTLELALNPGKRSIFAVYEPLTL